MRRGVSVMERGCGVGRGRRTCEHLKATQAEDRSHRLCAAQGVGRRRMCGKVRVRELSFGQAFQPVGQLSGVSGHDLPRVETYAG